MIASGTRSVFEVTQPVASGVSGFKTYQYAVLADHNLAGGEIRVEVFSDAARTSLEATTILDSSISAEDPVIIETTSGLERTGDRYLTVNLTGTNPTQSIGELMLVNKFDSPRAPLINVPSNTRPRRTYIDLPNGERRSIQHGQPSRVKNYRIGGLTEAQAQQWRDRFDANEGIRLITLTDDESETYVVLWNTALPRSRELDNFLVELEFIEVRL